MALATENVFEEHLGVIEALKDNYTRQDDAAAVAGVNSLREELAQLCAAREDEVKAAIRGLTERVAGAEAAAAYPRPEGAHAARVEELAAAAASAHAGVAELAAELAELGERRAALRAQLADLEARHARVEREVTAAEPHTRHLLSLYAHVSQISWHLDRPGRVAGDVSDPAAGDVRPFDLDPAAAPPPEVAARLWALMDGE